jgi:drug/metabolite transporter (DMT)-like permease
LKKELKSRLFGSLLVLLGAMLFACKAVIVKWLYLHHPTIESVSMLAIRMLFSVPFYVIILAFNAQKVSKIIPQISLKDWGILWAIGILGYYLASFFDFLGLELISASIERLVLFIYPTLVVLLSYFFLKKPISSSQKIALAITYFGVLVAFANDLRLGMSSNLLLGIFYIFMSALTYAMYLIGNGQLVHKMGVLVLTCFCMLVSSLMTTLHQVGLGTVSIFSFTPQVYYWMAVMAVFCTVIPSFLVGWGIKLVGSSNASIIGSIGPVTTIVLAHIFLNESFSSWQLIGTLLVVVGVLRISIKK